jgi:hypothetical protein
MWSIIVQLSEGGTLYMSIVYGIVGISALLLTIDTVFCAVEQVTDKSGVKITFLIFTYMLMALGVFITLAYLGMYYLMYREFK